MTWFKIFLFCVISNIFVIHDAICKCDTDIFYGSLNSKCVNARIGPGEEYPVMFTYKNRKFLPVKVIAKYKDWYKIVDPEGDIGWISKNLFSKRKTVAVKEDFSILYKSPNKNAIKLAKLEKNVIGIVEKDNDETFVKIKINNMKGWILKDKVFGL